MVCLEREGKKTGLLRGPVRCCNRSELPTNSVLPAPLRQSMRRKSSPRTLAYFPTLVLTLPIPVQRSQPTLAENPAVGPQKSVVMSLKSVVIARLL